MAVPEVGRGRSRSRSRGRTTVEEAADAFLRELESSRQQLRIGCTVRLQGLKNAAVLNGQIGVLESFLENTGRWRVNLNNGQTKDLKPESLVLETCNKPPDAADATKGRDHFENAFRPGSRVNLHGLKSGAQLNGQNGTLELFVSATSRWRVKLDDGQSKDLKPENLEVVRNVQSVSPKTDGAQISPQSLQLGCQVRLHSLKNAAELNGQIGILEEFVSETGRWRVKLNSGLSKDLKPENLTDLTDQAQITAEHLEKCTEEEDDEKGTDDEHERQFKALEAKSGDTCGPDGRFVLLDRLGKGNFSTVWRCADALAETGALYAVKVTRANSAMRKALEREIMLMNHLSAKAGKKDPDGVRCLLCLAFLEGFEYEGHLAVVLELMKYDVSTALERHGRGRGLPLLPTVRNFGRNIFLALRALRRAGLVHCDVKPENLLLTEDSEMIKLSDFGSTLIVNEFEKLNTDIIQPRYYRAPEVILGQALGTAIDMWSAGATIFQMATDCILLQGESNNDMLYEMLKVCGPFPKPVSTSGKFAMKHFNAEGDFLHERGIKLKTPMANFDPPPRALNNLLTDALREPPQGVPQIRHEGLVGHLVDLLGKCLEPDQVTRAVPEVALAHRFLQKGA